MRKKIAAGNWKMNGLKADIQVVEEIAKAAKGKRVECFLALPASLLASAPKEIATAGQDCHAQPKGAYTGDISAPMLADAGAQFVILGHSERRMYHKETNEEIAAKVMAAWQSGLTAVICIGESEDEYRAGKTLEVLGQQIKGSLPPGATAQNTIIAYEPVWAIGTGLTPTNDEIEKVHAFIRDKLPNQDFSILYGGSVSPKNATEIFALGDVDGGLVGGASLNAESFSAIINALEDSL